MSIIKEFIDTLLDIVAEREANKALKDLYEELGAKPILLIIKHSFKAGFVRAWKERAASEERLYKELVGGVNLAPI